MTVNVVQVIRDNIDATVHMSLATTANNKPWVCEVHFVYDDQLNLYFRSYSTRRHSLEIAQNPQVAGNIIGHFPKEAAEVLGIYFEGEATMLSDDEIQLAAQLFVDRLGMNFDGVVAEARSDDGHKIYKISVREWSVFGRFGADHSTKHTIEWGNQ